MFSYHYIKQNGEPSPPQVNECHGMMENEAWWHWQNKKMQIMFLMNEDEEMVEITDNRGVSNILLARVRLLKSQVHKCFGYLPLLIPASSKEN